MRRLISLVTLLLAAQVCPAISRIINVPGDYSTIQAGINASVDGDTVLVQPGRYLENINFGGHIITLASWFFLTGDTSYIASTVIDGHSAGSVISIQDGEDSKTLITGFTIQNGRATYGGGIFCWASQPRIRYNYLVNNAAPNGGAIWCGDDTSTCIENNKIWNNNSSSSGGGIECLSCYGRISGNVISGNHAPDGAGIMINTCQNLTITANHIVNNGGEWGAGIFCNYSNNITISENIIEQDSVLAQGGGIYADGENTTINDNIIRRNIAAEGAGIYFRGSRSTLINNLIEGNRACTNADTSCGGGVVSGGSNSLIISNVISDNMTLGDGGAICALNPWDCAIENNLVLSNSARSGGGISCRNGLKLIRNNILIENFAIEKGGGIHGFDEAMVLVENCILWQDSASLAPEISVDTGSIVVATYSDIGGGYPGRGIIDVDPLFRGPAGDDYHLSAVACGDTIDSPCIDNGDPAYSDSLLDCLWGLGDSRSDVGAFGGGQSTPNSRRRIYIPDDYPHIQAGIVAAHEGDTVVVRPGIYMGNIDFIGKRIIVGSLFLVTGDTSYMSSTIINGDSSGSVVEFTNGEDTSSIITGFTIQGGRRTGGIYCEDSSPSIVMNIIRNNSGTFGGGICCNQARPLIENNTIRENRAGYGGGIYCSHSSPTIRNNVITRCYSGA